MDLAIVVYLIGLVGNLKVISSIVLFASIFAYAIYLIFRYMDYQYGDASKQRNTEVKKHTKFYVLLVLLPCITIMTLLPSKKDMYIMTGLVVGENVLTSEKGNELLDKSYLLLVSKIEKSIEDTNKGESYD
ncbi:hypothetical protein [Vibrio phage vB_VhaM_VH-8]|nr:hypothetical protein [Vibrio phage vB_VhaM_VH-8]